MTNRISLLLAAIALAACTESPTALSTDVAPTFAKADGAGAAMASETLIGLTGSNELVRFDSDKSNQSTTVMITGLANGETVVGIDFRPSDTGANGVNEIGILYAVTSASRLYKVDVMTGAATMPVTLSIALEGSAFGVGFNPAADRLRIHSNTNQNLRINVETGLTIVDGALSYSEGDVNAAADPDLTAAAYTNNDANPATATELYAIDAAQDVLVEFGVGGPNGGKLVTVGALGVDAGMLSGFDISNATGTAYVVLSTSASDKSELYSVNLETGMTTKIGLLAQTKGALLGVAVLP